MSFKSLLIFSVSPRESRPLTGIVTRHDDPENRMSVHDVEQKALIAFLDASSACMKDTDAPEDQRWKELCDLANEWQIIYVRELMRPLLSRVRETPPAA
jgi:hypothetical protein